MTSIVRKFTSQFNIGGIQLFLPNFGGVFSNGILATISFFLSLVFGFMVVIWVGLSIYAGIKIISSAGNPEGIESGMKTIKNIWTGIALGLLFFVALSLIGVFVGFGSVLDWSTNLAQCGGASGEFLFQKKQSQEIDELIAGGATNVFVGCCDADADGEKTWLVADLSGSIPVGLEIVGTSGTVSSYVTN